jgi:hypothetical protein
MPMEACWGVRSYIEHSYGANLCKVMQENDSMGNPFLYVARCVKHIDTSNGVDRPICMPPQESGFYTQQQWIDSPPSSGLPTGACVPWFCRYHSNGVPYVVP